MSQQPPPVDLSRWVPARDQTFGAQIDRPAVVSAANRLLHEPVYLVADSAAFSSLAGSAPNSLAIDTNSATSSRLSRPSYLATND